jgi:hypothetical protein
MTDAEIAEITGYNASHIGNVRRSMEYPPGMPPNPNDATRDLTAVELSMLNRYGIEWDMIRAELKEKYGNRLAKIKIVKAAP